jgi:uncharacterized membrane protein YtjA (UPF0391 family)
VLRMSGLGIAFLVIALIAAFFGFGVRSDESWLAGKVFSLFFLFLAVLSFVWGWLARKGRPRPRRGPRAGLKRRDTSGGSPDGHNATPKGQV